MVTDGVFSMEGDIVRLDEMAEVARRHGARIYLDEAHAIGVIGPTGRGTEEHFGRPLADLVMCTFSKSFGSIGGFVAGDRDVVNYIKHHGRSLIFSASMPPANLAAAAAALKIMRDEPEHAATPATDRGAHDPRIQGPGLQRRRRRDADRATDHRRRPPDVPVLA